MRFIREQRRIEEHDEIIVVDSVLTPNGGPKIARARSKTKAMSANDNVQRLALDDFEDWSSTLACIRD